MGIIFTRNESQKGREWRGSCSHTLKQPSKTRVSFNCSMHTHTKRFNWFRATESREHAGECKALPGVHANHSTAGSVPARAARHSTYVAAAA